MTFILQDIPKRLKIARIAAGYRTARDFIRVHGIPVSTYSQHERGERVLTLENVGYYSNILNIDPAWLLTGKGNPCGHQANENLEKQIILAQEQMINTGELDATEIPIINSENNYATINVLVFRKILEQLIPLLRFIPDPKNSDAVDFCFEIYNRIITTNADENDRIMLIKFCFDSFFKGLEMGIKDDSPQSKAMVG